MSLTKRLFDVARANLTDFRRALWKDDLRELLEDDPAEDVRTVGGRVGRRARVVRDAAEEAWERAYQEAKRRPGYTAALAEEVECRRWYRVLELEPGASMAEVKTAYRRLLRKYHPDRHARDPEKFAAATELMRRITEAHDGLVAYLERRGGA